jgi:manganese/zinc/iron transport system permease protein
MGARPLWVLGGLFVALLAAVLWGWRELRVCAFDPGFARAVGLPVAAVHAALMAATSFTTVAAFEGVGAILVVAMLVGPAATAHLLTDRLRHMVALAVAIGMLASVLGYLLARALDASIAGCMSLAIGALFTLAALGSPEHGILTRAWRQRAAQSRAGRGVRTGASPSP